MPLDKGERLSLTKNRRQLSRLRVRLGWRLNDSRGGDFDLDVCAFMVNSAGRVPSGRYCVYYNNMKSPDGSTELDADDTRGGDGETLTIELGKVQSDVRSIVFAVSIYRAERRRQHFGMLKEAFVELTDDLSGLGIARFSLTDNHPADTALVLGMVEREEGDDWEFFAETKGYPGGLKEIGVELGVNFG